jgi:hypothetical protein
VFVNEFSAGLALVEKRARRDHRRKQEDNAGALKAAR